MSTLGSESAFPVPDVPITPSDSWLGQYRKTSDGISIRMLLAAQAMQGMLANGSRVTGLAASAFAVADDMLVEIARPGRLERLIDDLTDLKAAVASLLKHRPVLDDLKQYVEEFPELDLVEEKALIRLHELVSKTI
jgi:hypothetical protein